MCCQRVGVPIYRYDCVLFVERANELVVCGKVKGVTAEAEAKASLNRAIESQGLDPKPGELTMGRLKLL